MRRFYLLLLMLAAGLEAAAAGADTVRYSSSGTCWSIVHRLSGGERLSLLGQRYRLPSGTLERSYPALAGFGGKGELIDIPIGAYNRIVEMPWSLDTARPLYYKVQTGDRLSELSRCARISRSELMLINGLSGEPAPGSYLCVGWVRYDPRLIASSPLPAGMSAGKLPPVLREAPVVTPLPAIDTLVAEPRPRIQTMGDIWNEQTQNGEVVTSEKGSVAFYALTSKAPGAAAYAFHNAAARGAIIRVRNLNNGRSIYVKVLGPVPNTKQYSGAILGLSMAAKRALGVREERAFCELSYAGY